MIKSKKIMYWLRFLSRKAFHFWNCWF